MGSLSPFGRQLRFWRSRQRLSQLDLALRAETTARHISFVETGRSRPGRDLVLRLAASLELAIRDRNALLAAAGFAPAFAERDLGEETMRPYRLAVEAILERHMPYPACALDRLGRVRLMNATCRALYPDALALSPEDSIDHFFGSEGRQGVENWSEVAWFTVDRMRHDAARTQDARVIALLDRALQHLSDVPRPPPSDSPVMPMRLRLGDRVIAVFTTVLRFDTAQEVTMSELRVELMFPLDDEAAAFFRGLAEA